MIAPAAPACARDVGLVTQFPAVAAAHDRCFWLDGGASRPWSGNRSILGWLADDDVSLTYSASRREVTRHFCGRSTVVGSDIFEVLESEMIDDTADVFWVGYFGYASRADLPASVDTDGGMPDAVWMRTRNVQVIAHDSARGDIAARITPPTTVLPPVVPEDYAAAFKAVQMHLHAGNSYEVNLTHRLTVTSDLDPVTAYLRLRRLNPAPYAGFLQHSGRWLLSSSPERYATVDRDRIIETRPIKGTTPRGATPDEDEASRRHLVMDAKFRAENLMIVDLLRNDVGMVSEPGSVEVPVLMGVESYSSVHQLVSTVRGRLRDNVTTVGAIRALFPAGSMTGAPKLRTMEVIRDVESTPRGAYSGAFGWISGDGRADLAVVIRSLTSAGNGIWQLGTGGGITVQSEVREEYAEATWKAERLLNVFEPSVEVHGGKGDRRVQPAELRD
ncbi:anthranilate synthase component I family protein [Micromonospora sp. KC606]|uniref:anthranilate synthase component I family protein n=1 Tax=Micromonospora sp. KC606 TaxID=2530379 RepID=UPI00104680C2|nr:anthranilate synthase component I family protein [Micromonospora sp. KC606]TDC85799.1 anthranilate synthase component I family protein [Micromonospora sp. KC606]